MPGPGPGSCTTPTCIGPYPCNVRQNHPGLQGPRPRPGYSTLQNHQRTSGGYSLLAQDSCCNPRLNMSENYATLRRGLYPPNAVTGVNFNKSEFGHTKGPQISPSYAGVGISTSSSVVSSELNHSVTTSDTSDVSSERDRESEVQKLIINIHSTSVEILQKAVINRYKNIQLHKNNLFYGYQIMI